jgi:hypothetical protein|tara:strand:+ start:783 stop:1397 length:615 start_codon:yes stop_codon:yes gene_type:complete
VRKLKFTLVAMVYSVFIGLTLATGALAQNNEIEIKLGRYTITAPTPGWNSNGHAKEFSNKGETPRGVKFEIFELIPAGETFGNWSELWAVFVEHNLASDKDVYLRDVRRSYLAVCGEIANAGPIISDGDGYIVLVIHCPFLIGNPKMGQMSVLYLQYTGSSWVRMYHEARGPAYDPMDTSSWPLSREKVGEFIFGLPNVNIRSN